MVWENRTTLSRGPGPSDSQNNFARSKARLGHRQTHPAGFRRGASGAARIVVSSAAPLGAARMDSRKVGGEWDGAAGEVLLADYGGPQADGTRNHELEPALRRNQSGD